MPPFPRISYDDAVKNTARSYTPKARSNPSSNGVATWDRQMRLILSAQFDKPVLVHRYPAKVKAFYMEPDPERPELALCVNVLAPEGYGEIIGGSQRMASHELLLQRIHEHGLPEVRVQVVLASPQVRQRAAWRIRNGDRAGRSLDLRSGARSRDDSVSQDAAPVVSIKSLSYWEIEQLCNCRGSVGVQFLNY